MGRAATQIESSSTSNVAGVHLEAAVASTTGPISDESIAERDPVINKRSAAGSISGSDKRMASSMSQREAIAHRPSPGPASNLWPLLLAGAVAGAGSYLWGRWANRKRGRKAMPVALSSDSVYLVQLSLMQLSNSAPPSTIPLPLTGMKLAISER
jgi:hypothetical protein